MIAYSDRPSPLSAVDPRLKIGYCVVVSLLSVILGHPLVLGGLFAVTAAPWLLARPPFARIRLLAVLMGVTVLGTMISQGFFYSLQPRTELIAFFPGLSLSREGLAYGAVQSLRLLSVMSAGMLVVFTTHPSDLVMAMAKLGVPASFAFMLMLALRFVPETMEQARRILIAQQLRGAGGKGLTGAVRRFRLLLIPLVGISLRSARQVALAAQVRAYSGRRAPMRALRFSRSDVAIAAGLILLAGLGAAAVALGHGAAPGAVR
jgi:energy-coupling factor transport system permease protein